MKHTMVRYKVKPECAAENERLVSKVFEALHHERPAGLRYASFKLPDGVGFVHLVSRAPDAAGNPLMDLPAFREFLAEVKDRCVELPASQELSEIGSYGFFDA